MNKKSLLIAVILTAVFSLSFLVKIINHYKQLREEASFSKKIEFYQNTLKLMYNRQDNNLPSNLNLFIGDSHIQGLAVQSIEPQSVNFGIGHMRLNQLISFTENLPDIEKYKNIIVGIGVNDLLNNQHDEFATEFKNLLKTLSCCHDKLILVEIMPVNEIKLNRKNLNTRIIEANKIVSNLASQNGILHIKIFNKLLNEHGYIDENYEIGDGVHLNVKGYEILIHLIKKSLNRNPVAERNQK